MTLALTVERYNFESQFVIGIFQVLLLRPKFSSVFVAFALLSSGLFGITHIHVVCAIKYQENSNRWQDKFDKQLLIFSLIT